MFDGSHITRSHKSWLPVRIRFERTRESYIIFFVVVFFVLRLFRTRHSRHSRWQHMGAIGRIYRQIQYWHRAIPIRANGIISNVWIRFRWPAYICWCRYRSSWRVPISSWSGQEISIAVFIFCCCTFGACTGASHTWSMQLWRDATVNCDAKVTTSFIGTKFLTTKMLHWA